MKIKWKGNEEKKSSLICEKTLESPRPVVQETSVGEKDHAFAFKK